MSNCEGAVEMNAKPLKASMRSVRLFERERKQTEAEAKAQSWIPSSRTSGVVAIKKQ